MISVAAVDIWESSFFRVMIPGMSAGIIEKTPARCERRGHDLIPKEDQMLNKVLRTTMLAAVVLTLTTACGDQLTPAQFDQIHRTCDDLADQATVDQCVTTMTHLYERGQ